MAKAVNTQQLEYPKEGENIGNTLNNRPMDDRLHDDLNRFAALTLMACEAPTAVIWIEGADRLWFKSNDQNLQITDLSCITEFSQLVIQSNDFLEVKDSFADERFANLVPAEGHPTIRFYAGHPIVDANGLVSGALCVIDDRTRTLSDTQVQSLQLLADSIANLIFASKQKEKSQEKRFKAFFEHAIGLMCIHDLDGRIQAINGSGAKKLGYTPEELIGRSLYVLSPTKMVKALKAYLRKIARNSSLEGEFEILTKAGNMQIWLFSSVHETDSDGNSYVMTNALDITGRRALESDLKKTKETLEQTSILARIGGWEMDFGTQTLYWSPITKDIHEVEPDFQPDINKAITFYKAGKSRKRIKEVLLRAAKEGLPWDEELQIVTAKGNQKWVKAIGHVERKGKQLVRIYGTFQDISERVDAQQELSTKQTQLAAFIEHAPVAIAMLDTDLHYIAASRRWLEDHVIVGSVIGKHHYDLFPMISDEWKAQHQQALAGSVITEEQHCWKPDWADEDRYMYREVRPWFNHTGGIGGIILLTKDTTTSYLQQQELKKAMLEAEEANKAKSSFLANMSHEIRTPLNGVIGFTELASKTELSDTQQRYLSIINQSAITLRDIINDILDFSKIEAGQLELYIDRFDLFELSGDAADIIAFQAGQKGLEVLLNLSTDLPRYLSGDAVRLKQVLVNLLSNAVKFTDTGEIELSITCTDRVSDQALFRFAIRDTGTGIPRAKRKEIFDAFKQGDNSSKEKFGGTGLGLTISNKLLALMASRLQLKSMANGGSLFFFEVWLSTEPAPTPISMANRRKKKRVLLVDDNKGNRAIICDTLAAYGIQTIQAAGGAEALRILSTAEKPFDALMVDLLMPEMDGLTMLEHFHERARRDRLGNPDIILLHPPTTDDRLMDKLRTLGVKHRLMKPVKLNHLSVVLARLGWLEQQDKSKTDLVGEGTILQPLTILLVEDNLINMMLAQTILTRISPNSKILTAKDGVEGVSSFSMHKPDLVLMDIRMPEMNGYEATQVIRGLPFGANVPIIALTAGNTLAERMQAVDANMNDFVAKPFSEMELLSVIKKWI